MKSSKAICLTSALLWGIFAVFLVNKNAYAQTAKVSGTIINQRTAAPVAGATVTVKNITRSASADGAGKFIIEASTGEILVVTSVGFTPQEVEISSGEIKIQLLEADNTMENVVVIGYGTQKKKLVTGATSLISSM